MPSFSRSIIAYGSEQPLPARRLLRAGPLTVVLEGADLRSIRYGPHEALQRIYVAVRDHNWGTVPVSLSNMRVDARADSFDVSFDARHNQAAIDFRWSGTIHGRADGTISYVMDGRAHSTFSKNRIGLCVLHPMACAGLPCRVLHSDGTIEHGTFPRLIAPHQPFRELQAIAHPAAAGVEVAIRLDGDIFEMEDQRNWSDASFKTYSTPTALPFPVVVEQGEVIRQSLELTLHDNRASAPVSVTSGPAGNEPALSFTLLPDSSSMPRVGLCLNAGELPAGRELERLWALNLAHLRIDLDPGDPQAGELLLRSASLGLPLLVALQLGRDEQRELAALRAAVAGQRLPIAAWLVFNKQQKVTDVHSLELARSILGPIAPGAQFGGGTAAYFAELNRDPPPANGLEIVAYSIVPQVHAFDNASLVENLAAQAATVESARRLVGDRALAVGPVTLRPRFNPDATGPQPEPAPRTLPPEVDARQMSLFGAGWTVGSLKYLAEAGVASISYYDVCGWRGVMESATGSPPAFPSRPGMLFPLYHVLADAGEYAGASVVHSRSSDPLAVDGLALRDAGRLRILLANFGDDEREVLVGRLDGATVSVRLLDHDSFETATLDGAAFRADRGRQHALDNGTLRLCLPPFAVATIDVEDMIREDTRRE